MSTLDIYPSEFDPDQIIHETTRLIDTGNHFGVFVNLRGILAHKNAIQTYEANEVSTLALGVDARLEEANNSTEEIEALLRDILNAAASTEKSRIEKLQGSTDYDGMRRERAITNLCDVAAQAQNVGALEQTYSEFLREQVNNRSMMLDASLMYLGVVPVSAVGGLLAAVAAKEYVPEVYNQAPQGAAFLSGTMFLLAAGAATLAAAKWNSRSISENRTLKNMNVDPDEYDHLITQYKSSRE